MNNIINGQYTGIGFPIKCVRGEDAKYNNIKVYITVFREHCIIYAFQQNNNKTCIYIYI